MSQKIIKRLYVSSDALFDLRQGTLATIDPDFAASVTTKKDYYTRVEDLFYSNDKAPNTDEPYGGLDKECFNSILNIHKEVVIRNSIMTKILELVVSLYGAFAKQAISTPTLTGVEIIFNLHPFNFTDEEINEIFECIRLRLGNACNFTIVNINIENITISDLKENYVALIMYDYTNWLNHILNDKTEKSKLHDLVNVGLYVPRIFTSRKFTTEEEAEFTRNNTNGFKFMQDVIEPFINIQFVPIAFYCVNLPTNLPEYLTNVNY